MELRHLRYFAVLAEELNFTRAARRLRISQPPLSAQIKDLEEELGVLLFNRTKRSVALTPAGEKFLREARAILEHVDKATRSLKSGGELGGTITIAANPTVDLHLLPAALRRFRERHPDVEFCLRNLLLDDQIEALNSGLVDVAFMRIPLDEFHERGLIVEQVMTESLIAAVPADHPFAEKKSISPKAMKDERLIMWHRHVAPTTYDAVLAAFSAQEVVPYIDQETDSLKLGLGLVSAGLGIAIVPESSQVLRRQGVVYIPFSPALPKAALGIARRKAEIRPLLEEFLTVVREEGKKGICP